MKKCIRCGLPETYETIEFNSEGVCNICAQHAYKKMEIDWSARKVVLERLVDQHRGEAQYDCIVPFSGGKDSTFTLYYLVEELGLKPLVVQFNHGFMRPNLNKNNERTFKKLNVDVLSFTPKWNVVKRLMLESLVRKGDFCWHCHTGIFAYPMRVALQHEVPLVFWGEPSSEYTAYYDYRDDEIEMVDESRFNRIVNLGITAEDMDGMIGGSSDFDVRDLMPYTYPDVRDLKRLKYQSVCLGSFIPWDVKKQVQIIQDNLGWKGDEVEGMPPELYDYEKIECYMQGVRDYIKYLKRGYTRVSQMTALDVRNGRMNPERARELIVEYEGSRPPSLDLFLKYLDLSEDEFYAIIAKHYIDPWVPNLSDIGTSPRLWDHDLWYSGS